LLLIFSAKIAPPFRALREARRVVIGWCTGRSFLGMRCGSGMGETFCRPCGTLFPFFVRTAKGGADSRTRSVMSGHPTAQIFCGMLCLLKPRKMGQTDEYRDL
jgi:hypothetical protein